MTLPVRPAKQASWLTRGYYSAAPWARVPGPLVTETVVTFYRITRTKNSMGGFTGGSTGPAYFTAWCHVEIEESRAYANATAGDAIAPLQTRHYLIILPVSALGGDTTLLPARGDRVQFVDAVGRRIDMPINSTPEIPANVAEFIEITTDEFA